jgi:hypothetical protein
MACAYVAALSFVCGIFVGVYHEELSQFAYLIENAAGVAARASCFVVQKFVREQRQAAQTRLAHLTGTSTAAALSQAPPTVMHSMPPKRRRVRAHTPTDADANADAHTDQSTLDRTSTKGDDNESDTSDDSYRDKGCPCKQNRPRLHGTPLLPLPTCPFDAPTPPVASAVDQSALVRTSTESDDNESYSDTSDGPVCKKK